MTVELAIWRLVDQLQALPPRPSDAYRGRELDDCFAILADRNAHQRHRPAEGRIWAIWCDHVEPTARLNLAAGVQALSEHRMNDALSAFSDVIERWPGWAEAWNKRATTHYLLGNDADSIADIERTLCLEPRHFGALGGLAQICLRNGSYDGALAAVERFLRVHPWAEGMQDTRTVLLDSQPRVH